MSDERDLHLASLREQLDVLVGTLNELYHPVNAHDVVRIRAVEAQVAELRTAISERRKLLRAQAAAAVVPAPAPAPAKA